MTFTLEPIDRDDPAVQPLYADFIREADGPLVYDREGAGIDLEAEIVAGPPTDLVPPNGYSPAPTAIRPASAEFAT